MRIRKLKFASRVHIFLSSKTWIEHASPSTHIQYCFFCTCCQNLLWDLHLSHWKNHRLFHPWSSDPAITLPNDNPTRSLAYAPKTILSPLHPHLSLARSNSLSLKFSVSFLLTLSTCLDANKKNTCCNRNVQI